MNQNSSGLMSLFLCRKWNTLCLQTWTRKKYIGWEERTI